MPPELQTFISAPVLLFLVFGLSALVTAIGMVLSPNPVRAALFLVLNLFCVAVLYLLLNAYFLAAVQVIVYAGAIMVLFLFVIMLLNLGSPDRTDDRLRWQQPVAVVAGLLLASVFGGVIYSSVPSVPLAQKAGPRRPKENNFHSMSAGSAGQNAAKGSKDAIEEGSTSEPEPIDPTAMGTVAGVGKTLYNSRQPWLFPFEATSILLLIATVGSVVLAKRQPGEREV